MKERKALLEDARSATQAALAEGVVPGGGVALLRSEKVLNKVSADEAERTLRLFAEAGLTEEALA